MLPFKLNQMENRAPCKHILCSYSHTLNPWGRVKTFFFLKVVCCVYIKLKGMEHSATCKPCLTSVGPDDTSDSLNFSIFVYSDYATQSNPGIFVIVWGDQGMAGGMVQDQLTSLSVNVFFYSSYFTIGLFQRKL